MSTKIHHPFQDSVLFWFELTSPITGILFGLLLVWTLGGLLP
jgi:hypothetical protein